jgi:hypothetical protein
MTSTVGRASGRDGGFGHDPAPVRSLRAQLTVRRARIEALAKHPHSAVMVKDLQSGEVTAVEYKRRNRDNSKAKASAQTASAATI